MSIQAKTKIEFRQQSNKLIKNKHILSSNTLENINKEHTEKKLYKDLSLNFLKNYSTTSLTNKTCVNHSHKKIIVIDKSKLNKNKKFSFNLVNQNKLIKFPLKLNYNNSKQSISLKNLAEEDNLFNPPLRSSDKRKNTNTKIELFSTNSTLSFLNIKDNNKEISKPIKIKCMNNNIAKKKSFSKTFIQKRLKTKSSLKIKLKHIQSNLSLDKNINQKNKKIGLKDNNFTNSNKSLEFCLSYMKPINKRRNLSFGLNDNSNNSNTNSIKDLYNKKIKQNNLDNSNLLFDNMSFSLNKNKTNEFGFIKGYGNSSNLNNKINFNSSYKINTINNLQKKISLSSLPNLLCNNYMNMNNHTMPKNDLFNTFDKSKKFLKFKNKNKNKNQVEQKNNNIYIKINNTNNNKGKGSSNNYNRIKVGNNSNHNIDEKLKIIHFGIKSLLDGLYNIYINASNNGNNMI